MGEIRDGIGGNVGRIVGVGDFSGEKDYR